MKERPILISPPMVQAILSEQKVQTRRVIKPQPPGDAKWGGLSYSWDNPYWIANWYMRDGTHLQARCPYGYNHHRLWVRETWATSMKWDRLAPRIIPTHSPIWYKADQDKGNTIGKWRPSVHMPRWASRITLEIIRIKVERIQEISLRDMWHEGTKTDFDKYDHSFEERERERLRVADKFIKLWNSINAKRGFTWGTNPWVWVVEFKILED